MLRSNRWGYFLLAFICKVAETSTNEVSDSTKRGFDINNNYGLDYKVQDNGRAFQINEDYLNNSRRITTISPIDEQYNCDQCGIANRRRSRRRIKMANSEATRILGGKKVKPPRKYPWQVGIFQDRFEFGKFFCGGSIINDQWILTAVHCFYHLNQEKNIWEIHPRFPNSVVKVRVGEHKQSKNWDDDDVNTKDYETDYEDIKFHPKHVGEGIIPPFLNYDFALLKLKEKITFNSIIKPVCLPEDDNESYVRDRGIVSGWGTTKYQGWSDVLKEFEYRIISHKKCRSYWPKEYRSSTHICAGPIAHKGPCNGDSGGPLIVEKGGRYFQVGIVSFGPQECGTLAPAMYGRLSNPEVLDWIREITADGKC